MARDDRLPELTDYEDIGCRFHDHCLTCPFSYCIEDGVQSHRRPGNVLSAAQRAELRRLIVADWPATAIAAAVGCSRQMVYLARNALVVRATHTGGA